MRQVQAQAACGPIEPTNKIDHVLYARGVLPGTVSLFDLREYVNLRVPCTPNFISTRTVEDEISWFTLIVHSIVYL